MPPIKKATVAPKPQAQASAQPPAKGPKKKEVQKLVARLQAPDNTPLAERDVLYPEPEVAIYRGGEPLTVELAKQFLGWQDEETYRAQCLKDNVEGCRNGVKEGWLTEAQIGFGENYDFLDVNGVKIRLLSNYRNRPFKRKHCMALSQNILTKEYRYNGENVIIGKTGLVISGQHRLVAVVFAEQRRTSDKEKYRWAEFWDGPVYIETNIAVGIDEDQKTVSTIDNVMPRDLSDVFYTMDLYRDMNPLERREITRYLGRAVDFLWARCGGSGGVNGRPRVYETHPMATEYLDRHPKLKEAVAHVFSLNGDRQLSKIGLSPGYSAAVLYMMACYADDYEAYANADPNPNESVLDMKHWKKACQFWTGLSQSVVKAAKGEAEPITVHKALATLSDEEISAEGRLTEKMVILAKAWSAYAVGGPVSEEDLALSYDTDNLGRRFLKEEDRMLFGDRVQGLGIDLGPERWGRDPSDKEEVESAKEEVAEERQQKVQGEKDRFQQIVDAANARKKGGNGKLLLSEVKVKNGDHRTSTNTFAEEVAEVKQKYGGKMVLHKVGNTIRIYGPDANDASKALGLDMTVMNGVATVAFPITKLEQQKEKLIRAKFQLAVHDADAKATQAKIAAKKADPEAAAKKSRG